VGPKNACEGIREKYNSYLLPGFEPWIILPVVHRITTTCNLVSRSQVSVENNSFHFPMPFEDKGSLFFQNTIVRVTVDKLEHCTIQNR
jgi:hypothetical protein